MKLVTGMAQFCLSRRVPFRLPYTVCRIRIWKFLVDRTSSTCSQYLRTGIVFSVIVWEAIGYTTRTSSLYPRTSIWTQIRTFLKFYVQWLWPILEAWQTSSSSRLMRDNMLHVVFWPSFIYKVFHCCPLFYSLQISVTQTWRSVELVIRFCHLSGMILFLSMIGPF